MWPFNKKKRETKIGDNDLIPMTPKTTVSLGLPVFPSIPVGPNFHKSTQVMDETLEKMPLDLQSMTVIDLKNLAKDQGLKGYSSLNKEDLIDLLK